MSNIVYICQLGDGNMLRLNGDSVEAEHTGYPYPDTLVDQESMLRYACGNASVFNYTDLVKFIKTLSFPMSIYDFEITLNRYFIKLGGYQHTDFKRLFLNKISDEEISVFNELVDDSVNLLLKRSGMRYTDSKGKADTEVTGIVYSEITRNKDKKSKKRK